MTFAELTLVTAETVLVLSAMPKESATLAVARTPLLALMRVLVLSRLTFAAACALVVNVAVLSHGTSFVDTLSDSHGGWTWTAGTSTSECEIQFGKKST